MTTSRVLSGLRRLLAAEAVTDELYEDLEAVLGEQSVRPPREDQAALTDRLRTAASKLVDVVPRLISPSSEDEWDAVVDQMPCVVLLSAEQPAAGTEHGHLVRLANAVLTLLDLTGEAAEVP